MIVPEKLEMGKPYSSVPAKGPDIPVMGKPYTGDPAMGLGDG